MVDDDTDDTDGYTDDVVVDYTEEDTTEKDNNTNRSSNEIHPYT